MYGKEFGVESVVNLQRLKVLPLYTWNGFASPTLDCNALELTLEGDMNGGQCLQNLNSTCPILEKIFSEWDPHGGEGAREIHHDVLRVLDMTNMCHQHAKFVCPNVENLNMRWELEEGIDCGAMPRPYLTFECPKVVILQISEYKDLACVPWLLSLFPEMIVL